MTREERGYNYPLFCYIRRRLNRKRIIGIGIRIKGESKGRKIRLINTNKDGNKKNNKIIVKNNIT